MNIICEDIHSFMFYKNTGIKFWCLSKKKPDINGKSGKERHTGGYVLAAY